MRKIIFLIFLAAFCIGCSSGVEEIHKDKGTRFDVWEEDIYLNDTEDNTDALIVEDTRITTGDSSYDSLLSDKLDETRDNYFGDIVYFDVLGELVEDGGISIPDGDGVDIYMDVGSIGNIVANASKLDFGDVEINKSVDGTVTITNVGQDIVGLKTIGVMGTGFSRGGGTCVEGDKISPNEGCTIIIKFSPDAIKEYKGVLTILSDANNLNVELLGRGIQGMSDVDLQITKLFAPKSADNGIPFNISVTIKNNGTTDAGSFKVRSYFSVDEIPGNGGSPADQLLKEWDVASLRANEESTLSSSVSFNGFPIHNSYFVVVKVDAEDKVKESNEENNTESFRVFVSR
ncbi:MAG: choice-of-anchor D domain-containing protein [Deltaproteobacteria bacterium]|nr:choice-of-anchor D domain-containing protein [Deltaproteobacteria bacterium]